MSKSLEICCSRCPNYGPLWIKISSDSDKRFLSYCPWKFELISQINKVRDNLHSKFQVIWTNGFRVIEVGSWAEKICNLQFPVRLTDSLLIYFIRSQLLYLTWSDIPGIISDQVRYNPSYYIWDYIRPGQI